MKLRRIVRFLKERLQLLAGRVPSCRWVRLRLGAYHHWDPSLSRLQFGAIEKHLNECPRCQAEWENTSVLCHDLERLRRGIAGEPRIDLQVARLMVRINENEVKQASPRGTNAAWLNQYGYRLATLCLLIISVPLLNYAGHCLVTEYFKPPQSITEGQSLAFTLRNSAIAGLPIILMVAITLYIITLPLIGYVAYRVLRPRRSPAQAASSPFPVKYSANASVPIEKGMNCQDHREGNGKF